MPEIMIITKKSDGSSVSETLTYQRGKTLLEILLDAGCSIDSPCGGNARCGKCRVRIISGDAGDPTDAEKDILSDKKLAEGMRLACCVFPSDDLAVELPAPAEPAGFTLYGDSPDAADIEDTEGGPVEADIKKETVTFDKSGTPYEIQLLNACSADKAANTAFEGVRIVPWQTYTTTLRTDPDGSVTAVSVNRGDTTDFLAGAAVDIGTTTIVVSLVDMTTGERISDASMINPQVRYGQDVLTRITYEIREPEEGPYELQKAVVTAINELLDSACIKAGIDTSMISELSIAANTTMLHMLAGADTSSMGTSPFTPVFTDTRYIPAEELGIECGRGAYAVLLPSVSAFLGSDITAGAHFCSIGDTKDNRLFIDIGTNSEIILSTRGRLKACSCPAGPALEGMNISCGMIASDSAVEDMEIKDGDVYLETIGNSAPSGICGSGILAAVRELLKNGLLSFDGAFSEIDDSPYSSMFEEDENGVKRFVLCREPEEISISQLDIRQIQLAKAAILSGVIALLDNAGVNAGNIDEVVVAGQFGTHINEDDLTATGLLPEAFRGKITFAGNTSLSGAAEALLSVSARDEMASLADHIDYIELSNMKNYESLFNKCLMF
jgi:uncharacterized 2Fe-2S/4Fe-4S cluster protein (DUF4445 family)